jgi:hypothetical protein
MGRCWNNSGGQSPQILEKRFFDRTVDGIVGKNVDAKVDFPTGIRCR